MTKAEKIFNKVLNVLLIIGIIIGSIFAGYASYAATTYAISSSNVEYKDNSSLGVTNVQAAIDGTCSKIDTRLSSIEKSKLTKEWKII